MKSTRDLDLHGWRRLEPLVFGALPILFTGLVLTAAATHNYYAVDFHRHFWPAAYQVLHGRSPFPSPHDTVTLGSYIYPAFAAVVLVPFALVSRDVADPIFTVILSGALFATLRVLRVRDWRCFCIILLWPPVFHALHEANFTIVVTFGLAVLWRVRRRSLAPALVLGALIALKVFLWPLVVWFIAAKRFRTAAWSVAFAALISLGAWATVGFSGLTYYPRLVAEFDRISAPATYTLVGFGMRAGLSHAVAQGIAWLVGFAALGLAILATRRDGLTPRSFALMTFAVVLLSPIVWLHYFTLLLVPLALLRPRFGPLWLLPLLAWPLPVGPSGPSFRTLPLLLGAAILIALATRSQRVEPAAERSLGRATPVGAPASAGSG